MELDKNISKNEQKRKFFGKSMFRMNDVINIVIENSNNEQFNREMKLIQYSNFDFYFKTLLTFYKKDFLLINEVTEVFKKIYSNTENRADKLNIMKLLQYSKDFENSFDKLSKGINKLIEKNRIKLKNGTSLLQFTVDCFNLALANVIAETKSLDYLIYKQNELVKNDIKKAKEVPIKIKKKPLQTNCRLLAKQYEAYNENKKLETEELKQDKDKLAKQVQTLKQVISKYHIQVESINEQKKEMAINIEKQKEDIETLKYRDRDKEEKIKELERLVLETNETHRKKIIELKTEIQELFEKFENQKR